VTETLREKERELVRERIRKIRQTEREREGDEEERMNDGKSYSEREVLAYPVESFLLFLTSFLLF